MRDWDTIRDDFPILKEKINGHPLIYLDNAATTQMPVQVINSWVEHYQRFNGNVHRGIHTLSELSTAHMEDARDATLRFLNAVDQGCIVFTSGATESANLVAESFLRSRLGPGSIVLSTELEHHSNYVVWQQLCRQCGATFRVIPTVDGDLDMNSAREMLNENVKLLAVTALSNVLGTVVDLKPLIRLAHEYDIPVYVDAAQAIRHIPPDFHELDFDFLGFSAHKMMGPAGVGVLFIRDRYIPDMKPYKFGGGMVDIVKESETTFPPSPGFLEAGTPNYSGIIAYGAALDYLDNIGFELIYKREAWLTQRAEKIFSTLPYTAILGSPARRAGVISVHIEGIHPFDLASFADKFGLAVRTGSMCAQPIVNKYGLQTVTRISTAFYNTEEELIIAADIIKNVILILTK